MTYDKMGNILSLQRYGKRSTTTFGLIDDLTLSYRGNQLLKVTDAVPATAVMPGSMHFIDNSDSATEYAYDGNGNLVTDLNKGIVQTRYNLLNLPQTLMFTDGDSISYLYGTDGAKLRVRHAVGSSVSTTDYIGNMIYDNGQLDKVSTENGYIDFSGSSPSYHYYLADHLGNNRVVRSESGAVEQVNHYYPFGGLMAESSGGEVQPRKFGGKELDTNKELNLSDFGSRQYDALLPRFTSVDPLQEKRYSISPYAYCSNNPVLRVDPDGRDDYRLDRRTGAITHFVSTEDKYDRILAFDAKGKIREVQVEKDVLASGQHKTLAGERLNGEKMTFDTSVYTFTDLSSAESMFEFVAGNSNVEWSRVEAVREGKEGEEDVNFIGTSQNKYHDVTLDYVASEEFAPLKKVQTATHSHPSNNGKPSDADIDVAKKLSGKYSNIKFYIYTPATKKYIPYTKDKPINKKKNM